MQNYIFNKPITDLNEKMLFKEKQMKITAILQIFFNFTSDRYLDLEVPLVDHPGRISRLCFRTCMWDALGE